MSSSVDAKLADLSLTSSSSSSANTTEAHNLSLGEQFSLAYADYQKLIGSSSSSSSSSAPPITHAALLTNFQRIQARVRNLQLISPNEELDDISVSSLRFIAVPYYIAEILINQPGGMGERLSRITYAMANIQMFIKDMQKYKIISKQDDLSWKRSKQEWDESTSSSSLPANGMTPAARVNPAQLREEKIARFKKEKELTEKLKFYEDKKQKLRQERSDKKKKGFILSNANEANTQGEDDTAHTDEGESETGHSLPEEEERELLLLQFNSYILKILDHTKYLAQEVPMLKFAAQRQREQEEKERQMKSLSESERQKLREEEQRRKEKDLASIPKPIMYQMTSSAQLNQPIPANFQKYMQPLPTVQTFTPQQPSSSSSSSSSHKVSTIDTNVNALIASRLPDRNVVFRDANPALYTPEQWMEMQIAQGLVPMPEKQVVKSVDPRRIRSRPNEQTQPDTEEVPADELDGERAREAEEKARQKDANWDNWKDDNEKGAGNKMK